MSYHSLRSWTVHLAAFLTLAGCQQPGAPAAPASVSTTPGSVNIQIADLEGGAVVVGSAVPLIALVTVDGRPAPPTAEGVVWRSLDPGVATVDARGRLTGVTAGTATITASVKQATTIVAIEVVPSLAGDVTITWIATYCGTFTPGCSGRPPQPTLRTGTVTVKQTGGRLDADWKLVDYISGYAPFSGRIRADGSMDLSGVRCILGDSGNGAKYSLTDWHMQMISEGVYSGRLRWMQESGPGFFTSCNGPVTSSITADLIIGLHR